LAHRMKNPPKSFLKKVKQKTKIVAEKQKNTQIFLI